MNPRRLKPYIRARQIRTEDEDRNAWLTGLYVHSAIVAVLPAPKGQKRAEYPKKPMLSGFTRDHDEHGDLTDDALKRKEDALMHRLEIARFNAELAKM